MHLLWDFLVYDLNLLYDLSQLDDDLFLLYDLNLLQNMHLLWNLNLYDLYDQNLLYDLCPCMVWSSFERALLYVCRNPCCCKQNLNNFKISLTKNIMLAGQLRMLLIHYFLYNLQYILSYNLITSNQQN